MDARITKLENETYLRFEDPQMFHFFSSAVGKEEGYFPSISITVHCQAPLNMMRKRE